MVGLDNDEGQNGHREIIFGVATAGNAPEDRDIGDVEFPASVRHTAALPSMYEFSLIE
jgi:hypothetical protein